MTIGTKLTACFGAMLVLSIALGLGAINSVNSMEATVQKLSADSARAGSADATARRIAEENRSKAESDASFSRWVVFSLIGLSLALGAGGTAVIHSINGHLKRTGRTLGDTAEQMASAAAQVSAASQSLAQGASEQAASIEETSASAEEITSMTRKNSQNSIEVATLMEAAGKNVTEVDRALNQMTQSMGEINASSDKIAKIIKVIDEIAFQTNILALNAAVEAARAGEAGMGFAVVADEVRNLAQRCAQAARDTAGLIEESIERASEGSRKLDDVARAMKLNTELSMKVKTLADEVSLGSQEQSRGITEVSKALAQMQQVTQKTASSSEETAASGEELSAQAASMQAAVQELQSMVGASELEKSSRRTKTMPKAVAPRKQFTASLANLKQAAGTVQPAPKPADAFPLEEEFKEF